MNRVHEQCPKIDSGTVLSQTGSNIGRMHQVHSPQPSSTPRPRPGLRAARAPLLLPLPRASAPLAPQRPARLRQCRPAPCQRPAHLRPCRPAPQRPTRARAPAPLRPAPQLPPARPTPVLCRVPAHVSAAYPCAPYAQPSAQPSLMLKWAVAYFNVYPIFFFFFSSFLLAIGK